MEKRAVFPSLLLSFLPVLAVAVVGSLLTDTVSSWYLGLQKPSFDPPKWVFPLMWSVVYFCAALSLYLYARSGAPFSAPLVTCLVLSGLCNVLWTLTFFALHQLLLPCFILIFLLALLLYCGLFMGGYVPLSGVLLTPHILWGIFALLLNVAFFIVNL